MSSVLSLQSAYGEESRMNVDSSHGLFYSHEHEAGATHGAGNTTLEEGGKLTDWTQTSTNYLACGLLKDSDECLFLIQFISFIIRCLLGMR